MTLVSPSSEFYVLGGTLPRDAPSYAVRKADEELLDGLRKRQFCYVLTSRQMGKSSLMVRTVTRLRQENVTCLVIDLTATGQNLTEDQWYDGLLNRIAIDLNLEDELEAFWQEHQRLGPLQRWIHALKSVILARIPEQVVIFVDEIDAVRSLPFSADEFFAAVRECFNRRTKDPEFERLTFCLLGVATPADLIRDTRSTPFNIGKRIELSDFTEAEAEPLAEGLIREGERGREGEGESGRHLDGKTGRREEGETALLNRVLYWTHGHPYLTQRLCSAVVEAGVTSVSEVDHICNDIFLTPGAQITDDNLLFVRERMLRAEGDPTSLLMLYDKVRSGKRVQKNETDYQISILRLSGIVRVENGELCVRNRIYSHVFDRIWVKRNIPGVEQRRQQSAFRKGVFGTAVALGSLLLMAFGGFLLTHYQKHLNQHISLPDGTELIVNNISFGKTATYETGAIRWSALFGSPGPFGIHQWRDTFPGPTLSVWLSLNNPKTGKTETLWTVPGIVAVDEHGHEFVPTGGDINSIAKVTRFDFENFPRRGKSIKLRLLVRRDAMHVVMGQEFSVPNPAPNLYPLWTPDPLPDIKVAGSLNVRLKSVNWSALRQHEYNAISVESNTIEPDYECLENGMPATPRWQIESRQISDATGNSSGADGDAGGTLCIYEPAWKLQLRLARRPEADFTTGETWMLKGASMPADGNIDLLAGNGTVAGVTLRPISIAAAPTVTYPDVSSPTPSGTLRGNWGKEMPIAMAGTVTSGGAVGHVLTGSVPQIAVRVAGLRQSQKVTVWATDEAGRRFNQEWEGIMQLNNSPDDTRIHIYFLPIPMAERRVDLHFAVQDIKTVEFMVRPPLPGESASK